MEKGVIKTQDIHNTLFLGVDYEYDQMTNSLHLCGLLGMYTVLE